ncbi:MAG: formylmethanofuran dehydrogenase subunit C [Planctomycetota bacterium]
MNHSSPSAWTFEVREPLRFALDVSGLDPGASSSAAEVLATIVHQGRERVPLGDLVRVTSSCDGIQRWTGHLEQVDGIGAGNRGRRIEVLGSPRNLIGAAMSAGSLRIDGSVGDDLGSELSGGTVVVTGSAGARAGGFSPGSRQGMKGGVILVGGNAGPEAGQKMRRGLIAIRGRAAAGAANSMIAGTLIAGELSGPFGLGLKRGTIICQRHPRIPAWFGPAIGVELSFTQLLAKFLSTHDQHGWFSFLSQATWLRAQGDRIERNQGELLVASE